MGFQLIPRNNHKYFADLGFQPARTTTLLYCHEIVFKLAVRIFLVMFGYVWLYLVMYNSKNNSDIRDMY